ncbi:MAG: hypothetical protein IPK19_19365 [Chloroflexi bacterium]|nr:hypothetical protein [Chloroflexota bacterium]
MLEQVGNAITFLAFYTAEGVGADGLAVTVDVRRGSATVISGAAAAEIGGGLYSYTLASGSVTNEALYTAVFKTTSTAVDQKHLPALWAVGAAGIEHLDADISDAAAAADPLLNDVPGSYAAGTAGHQLGRIGSAEVGVTAAVAASGRVVVYQGKDYAAADGTALEWTSATPLAGLDAAGASVTLDVNGESFPAAVSGAAGGWTIRVDLAAAQTAALPVGASPYELAAVLANGRTPPPLATGTVEVRADR